MTVQEQVWKSDFGVEYTKRNRVRWNLRIPFWQDIINWTQPESVLDVGTNAGWNLLAIGDKHKDIELKGIDVNPYALAEATAAGLDVEEMSALDVGTRWPNEFDLVASSGVLIHIAPDDISQVMDSMIAAARRHVLAIEYPSKVEREINYQGRDGLLWKRHFGAMFQDKGLILMEEGDAGYGFNECYFWLLRVDR